MLLIHLLNNSQQLCLLMQMNRLLDKHPDGIETFMADYYKIMFAKSNGSTVGWTLLCLRYIYCRFCPQLCLLRKMDRLLDREPEAFNSFLEYFPTNIFVKVNVSSVGETHLWYWRIYCRFFRNYVCKDKCIDCCINTRMLLIHLLNNFQELYLLMQMNRLLDKHTDGIDIFMAVNYKFTFAKTNGSTVG